MALGTLLPQSRPQDKVPRSAPTRFFLPVRWSRRPKVCAHPRADSRGGAHSEHRIYGPTTRGVPRGRLHFPFSGKCAIMAQ